MNFQAILSPFSGNPWDFWFWVSSTFEHFFGQKIIFTPLEPIFYIKWMFKQIFSLKFQLWAKMIAAPPGVQTVTGKKALAAISGMVIGMKNMYSGYQKNSSFGQFTL